MVFLFYSRQKKTHRRGGLFGDIRVIGITKEGQLIMVKNSSPLTGVKLIGVLITNPNDLSENHLNIANHFYHKDSQQLHKLVLEALRTNLNHHHLSSEQP